MINFKGKPIRKVYDNGDNYKMYGFDVNKNAFPAVKFNKYGNAMVTGDLPELEEEIEYEIEAEERYSDRYGYRYEVVSINPVRSRSKEAVYAFLKEILTEKQANVLFKEYPDIIDRVINNQEIDINKLHGIGEFSMNLIRDKIINNYQLLDYVNLFGGAISLSKIQKLYEEYNSVQRIEELLYKDPYEFLTRLGGIGFKKADAILKKLIKEEKLKFEYELETSIQRCRAGIIYILKENEKEGHTKMELRACYDKAKDLIPECIRCFKDACEDKKYFYLDVVKMIIARIKIYEDESYICNKIQQGLKTENEVDYSKIDIEKYRNTGEYELSDEQMNFLRMALDNNICILTAPGGTGKSAATGVLVKMLSDSGIMCTLMTPTGRSAKVLQDYAKYPASTIHRALNYNPSYGWLDEPITTDVVIIDEFSMCSIHLMKHILRSIDFTKTKLIMIGDNEQLPPVDAGNLLHDFIFSKSIPTAILTKVFRYGTNGLLTVATDIRLGKEYLTDDKVITIGDNKDYIFKRCQDENIVKEALDIYKTLITTGVNGKVYKPEDIAILSSYNIGDCGAIRINEDIQSMLHKENDKFVQFGNTKYYIDDIVMQTRNDYKSLLYRGDERTTEEDGVTLITNGETGVVKKYNKFNELGVDFGTGSLIKRSRASMYDMQLGYAYSIYKSQGGSIKAVILLTPKSHLHFLTSNLIYVGITRTVDICFHLGLQSTVKKALTKKENFNRMTFAQEFLRNDVLDNSTN